MRGAFIYDMKFLEGGDGVYSHYGAHDDMYRRYLDIFDSLLMVGRRDRLTDANQAFMKERYRLRSVDFKLFHRYYWNVYPVVADAVDQSDFCVLRFPSIAAVIGKYECERVGRGYVAEVVGNVGEALSMHGPLGKILAEPLHQIMKASISSSRHVSYITQAYLQNVYPTQGFAMGGVANVSLKELRPDAQDIRAANICSFHAKERISIGLIGSLDVDYKGHEAAIRALREIRKVDQRIVLHFLGPGSPDRWEQLAKELGVWGAVVFEGSLPGGDAVLEWLDGMDFYIQPSLTEGHGRAAVEAMSRGCITFAARTGGLVDSVAPSYLFDSRDYGQIARLICRALVDYDFSTLCVSEGLKRSEQYLSTRVEAKRRAMFEKAFRHWGLS